MRVTITKPNTPDDYGRPQAVGNIITVPDEYGKYLVRALLATDTDSSLAVNPNDPFAMGRVLNSPTQVSGVVQGQTGGSSINTAVRIVILGDSHTRNTGGIEPIRFINGSRSLPSVGTLSSQGLIVSGYSDAAIASGLACNIRWDGTNLYCKISTDAEGPGTPLVSGTKIGGYLALTGGAGTYAGKQIVVYTRQRFASATTPATVGITLGSGTSQVPNVNKQGFDSWLSFLFAKEGLNNYQVTNFAVSGDSTYDQRMGSLTEAVALAPRVAFIRSGYNDNSDESLAEQNTTPATGRPSLNIAAMVDALLAAGAYVVLALPVWALISQYSANRNYYGQLLLNAALRKAYQDNPRVALVESYQALLDYAATGILAGSGNASAQPIVAGQAIYFKPDQAHPNFLGAFTEYNHFATAITAAIAPFVPRRRAQPKHPGERSPSTLESAAVTSYGGNPRGNAFGMMGQFRTAWRSFPGGLSGGLTLNNGAVPGDWSLNLAGTQPTVCNVYPADHASAGTSPEGDGARALRFEITAGAATATLTMTPIDGSYIINQLLGGAAVTQGKRARFSTQMRMTTMALFDSMVIKASFTGTINGVAGSVMDVIIAEFDTGGALPAGQTIADTGILQLVSHEFTVPLALTAISPRIQFAVKATGTVNMDVFPMVLEMLE